MSTKCSSGAVPGGKIPSAHNKRNPKPVPSSVTASPCHLPPRGKAYGRPHGAAPTKFKGTSGFAVGADDLGGPRAHTVRPYRPIGMFQGGRVRAPAPTAYPKVRLIFCRARCPHRAVPVRPSVPPLQVEQTEAIMCVGAGHRPARKRAADSHPYEIQGSFRFCRRGRRPRRPAGARCAPIQANRNVSGRVRAPAPTAYPKMRLSFVGPDAPIGPFPGGPVCRPYEINANIRRDPDPPALPAFYLE